MDLMNDIKLFFLMSNRWPCNASFGTMELRKKEKFTFPQNVEVSTAAPGQTSISKFEQNFFPEKLF